ncbi:hypothetical protein K461DRAFT_274907 [Myriangium duriaei CBS 260.36]|uniref:Uncharacterized protein n=1 Tax=Myriangium duriaei CBS 260.36 TaxID=1168546 RepID=A0A9P4J9E7_9PEZI|nr:hypothetical protein K461DRAFT_274907 [Myriangium duriaei CBS 260.36]
MTPTVAKDDPAVGACCVPIALFVFAPKLHLYIHTIVPGTTHPIQRLDKNKPN